MPIYTIARRRFEQQLRWWYVRPLERLRRQSGHNEFAVVALGCVLLDTLSQYDAGRPQSSGHTFRLFIQNKLPHLCNPFPQPIRIWNEKNASEGTAIDFADVLWNGFRCGILHEAHVPLYARLWGVSGVYEFVADGFATYSDTVNHVQRSVLIPMEAQQSMWNQHLARDVGEFWIRTEKYLTFQLQGIRRLPDPAGVRPKSLPNGRH